MKNFYKKAITSETTMRAAYIREYGESEYTDYWAQLIDWYKDMLQEVIAEEEAIEEERMG